MKRYVIERDLPGVGAMNGAQLKDAAATSNAALAKLAGKVQWDHSYVVDNKPSAFTWPKTRPLFGNTPS
jgi:hypothetical protein